MLRLKPKFSLSTIASPVAFSKDSAKKLFTPFFLCKELDKWYTSLVIVTMIKVMIPFLVLTSLMQQKMTECLILFVRKPLVVWFMTLKDLLQVHLLSKPWSKPNHTCSRTIHTFSKQYNGQKFTMQNKMVLNSWFKGCI